MAAEPKTEARAEAPFTAVGSTSFTVSVVEGAERGASLRIDGRTPSRAFVGGSPACELRVGDQLVSRRHLALELAGARLRLSDLDSTNGTEVNGVRVVEALLGGGERVRIGDTTLAVERGDEAIVALPPAAAFGRVVGNSAEMRRLHPLFEKLAASTVPVVIEGETGTGKEVLAESIHDASARSDGPFVVFDCTALPASLMEAALFGHERGAFTGAAELRKGVFEQAHGGTLFLDEIGDLEAALQAKLLRALERSEVRRLGGDRWLAVDVRVLAATRRDLDREVVAGRFRDDLFFRLAVARVELPPLRRRRGDVTVLARHFAEQLGGDAEALEPELLARLEAYGWPGNVRELRNTLARHLALGELDEVGALRQPTAEAATDAIERILALDLPFVRARERVIEELSRRYVERALEQHGGNVTHAARASGLGRRYFQAIKSRAQSKEE
jgi:two-component system, NtrC family, response regulator HydG